MKEVVVNILREALSEVGVKLKEEEIDKVLETPPSVDMGDYSFPCFFLASYLKKSPNEIALELREKIGNIPETDLDEVQTSGPYVNFFIDRKNMARKLVWEAITKKKNFGKSKIGNNSKIVLDFSSPNIAKPFGIGHLRSTIIGNAIANISEFIGYKTVRMNHLGDWGTQFGKLIYGFEQFGNENKLMKNPIKHLLDIYVKVNKYKKFEEPSREAFKKLEARDRKSLMLWKLFKQLSLKEFQKIYDLLGIEFDVYGGESEAVKYTKRIVDELQDKKLLVKSKGALIVDLNKYNLGVCLIQKTDGTTLYATRDIAEAVRRYEKYKFAKMIYQVGQEQNLYFRQIFKVLELLGYEWAKDCIHSEHGLYLDKDGKKFATRKGKLVLMEEIIDKTKTLTRKEIKKRFPKLSKKELDKRALVVALAAIFYGDLKNNKKNNIAFDLNKFTSFEGDTGPYILYTYARATSILKKSKNPLKFKIEELDPKELELAKKLSQFESTVVNAFEHLNPSLISNYCYQIAQKFNEFYQTCPVINSEQESFRLALVEAFRQVLKNALGLLGINVLEQM